MINIPTSFLYVTRVTGVYIGGQCLGGRLGVSTCIASSQHSLRVGGLGVCCPFFLSLDVAGLLALAAFHSFAVYLWFLAYTASLECWVGGWEGTDSVGGWLVGRWNLWMALVDGICGRDLWMDGWKGLGNGFVVGSRKVKHV
jgi:hypothetical protein